MLYIAPEIHRGEHFDEGSDVYSFAIVMWEMVTKQVHPFFFFCHANVSRTNRSKFHTFEQVSHRNIRINLSQPHLSYPLFLAPIRRQAHCIHSRHSRLGQAAPFKSCESRAYP